MRRHSTVARGGTWTYGAAGDAGSLIPNGDGTGTALHDGSALYLPLFYGDAEGLIFPGAATEVPTIGNGGVSADATTWTFHLRPGLVWSTGSPTMRATWILPGGSGPIPSLGPPQRGLNLISTAVVSADHLSITFHLTRPFAPSWRTVGGWRICSAAGTPFQQHSARAILKSSDNLNPKVTSGPFMMAESVPGDHVT